jgi:hypothetical protein
MVYYILLLQNLTTSNGYVYKEGLNIFPSNDSKSHPSTNYLYFRDLKNLFLEQYYHHPFIAKVDLINPDQNNELSTSSTVISYTHYRYNDYATDKCILGPVQKLEDFFSSNPDAIHIALKQDGTLIKFIKNQTSDICIEAVKQNGLSLQYVKEQTADICIEAVKQNGLSLCFVKEQTADICIKAVKQNGLSLCYVKEQTDDICIKAVKHDGLSLQYVKDQNMVKHLYYDIVKKTVEYNLSLKKNYWNWWTPSIVQYINDAEVCENLVKEFPMALMWIKDDMQTHKMCIEVMKKYGMALRFVANQTLEICLEAVKNDGMALQYVNIEDPIYMVDICIEAIKQNPSAIIFVKNKSAKIYIELVKKNYKHIEFIEEQTPEICIEAVSQYGLALKFVKDQTHEICINAVKQYGLALQYVKNKTYDICIEAVRQNGFAIKFVDKNQEGYANICKEALNTSPKAISLISVHPDTNKM